MQNVETCSIRKNVYNAEEIKTKFGVFGKCEITYGKITKY